MSGQQTEWLAGKSSYCNLPSGPPKRTYQVTLEEDGEWIAAYCKELGVVTQGRTRDDVEANIIEAVEHALDDDGQQEFIIALMEIRP